MADRRKLRSSAGASGKLLETGKAKGSARVVVDLSMSDDEPKPNADIPVYVISSSEDELSLPPPKLIPHKRKRASASQCQIIMEEEDKMSDICESSPLTEIKAENKKMQSSPAQLGRSNSFLMDYEDLLRKAKARLEAEHGDFVRLQLLEASARIAELQKNQPNFRDDFDQFADLSLQERPSGSSDSTQAGLEKLGGQSEESVPKYKEYTRITRSFLVEDNHQLAYEPYINEDEVNVESRFRKKLCNAYGTPPDATSTRRDETASRLRVVLHQTLGDAGLCMEDVTSNIADHRGKCATHGIPALPIVKFMAAFEKVFGMAVEDVVSDKKEENNILNASENKPKDTEKSKMIEEMLAAHLTACPLCGVHGCGAHGDHESSDDEETTNKKYCDLNMPFDSMLQRHNEKQAQEKDETLDACFDGDEACSVHCFLNDGDKAKNYKKWTTEDVNYLDCVSVGMENQRRASCLLALLIGKSCVAVHHQLCLNSPTVANSSEEAKRHNSPLPRLDWYDNKTKTIRNDKNWQDKTTTHLHESRRQPFGCDHKGLRCHEAKDQCHCFHENTLCDKFCSCSDDCHLKFTGCNCSKSGSPCSSNSETCVCRLLNRECDPDLCHTCGAIENADPFTCHEQTTTKGCRNTLIQQGLGVSLLIGESKVSGFGAILGEAVRRDQYIGEYVGEIISSEEADRRSVIYDKFQISYFFTLNESKVIDSYRFGNTTRFINHGRKNENCYPKGMLVCGEHRIAFFAQYDMPAGTELFFDYGEGFLKKHKLRELSPPPGHVSRRRDQMARIDGRDEDEPDEDLDEGALTEQALAAIPEYDTDEYEESGRGGNRASRRGRKNPSEDVVQRERPKRKAAEKPVKYLP